MAHIIGEHQDGSEAAAYSKYGATQMTVTHWEDEPTTAQLAQYPNSTWCTAKAGKQSYESNCDNDNKPIRSVPSQTHWIDKVIMFFSIVSFVIAVLFLLGMKYY